MKKAKLITVVLVGFVSLMYAQNKNCAGQQIRFSDSYYTPFEKASASYNNQSTFLDSGVIMHVRYKMIPVDGRISNGFSILRQVNGDSFFWLKPQLNQTYKLDDSTCAIRILPSINDSYKYKFYDREALNGLKMIMNDLSTSGELKLTVQQTENTNARCECKIAYNYSDTFKSTQEYYEKAKSVQVSSKTAPVTKFSDSALEDEIKKMISNSKPHYKVKRVSTAQADWSIIKSKLGIIQHRGKRVITVYEDTKSGKCYFLDNFVKQNYIGPDKYGATYFDVGWDNYPSEVNCNTK